MMAIRIPRLLSFQMTKSLLQSRSFCIKQKSTLWAGYFPLGFFQCFSYTTLSSSLSCTHKRIFYITCTHVTMFSSNTITLTTSFGYPLPFICPPYYPVQCKIPSFPSQPIKETTLLSTLSTLNWPMRCHLCYMGCT